MVIYYENTTQSVWHTVILSLLDRRTDDFRYDECNFCLNVTRMRSYRRMHLHMYLRAHNAIITAMSQPSEDKDDFQRHIAPHRLSGTQEEPVAIEAERESCFPFCDERPSAGHSGESAPLFVLRLHPSSLAKDTKGSLSVSARFLYFSVVGMFVTIASASPCYCVCSSEVRSQRGLFLTPAMKSLLRKRKHSE